MSVELIVMPKRSESVVLWRSLAASRASQSEGGAGRSCTGHRGVKEMFSPGS